jgi:hypothetical protein
MHRGTRDLQQPHSNIPASSWALCQPLCTAGLPLSLPSQDDKYRGWVEALQGALDAYSEATGALAPVEAALLAKQLSTLRAALAPGLRRLSWASLGVPEFVAAVQAALTEFRAITAQVWAAGLPWHVKGAGQGVDVELGTAHTLEVHGLCVAIPA